MQALTVTMLDGFSIEYHNRIIDERSSRSRKAWLLLAYLIYRHDTPVPQDELYQLLWGDSESKDDPQNALRVTMHRTRALLAGLGLPPEHNPILRQKEGYIWNPALPVHLDAEEFYSLCTAGLNAKEPEQQVQLLRKALALYQKDLLYRQAAEPLVRELSLQLHNLYMEAVHRQVTLLTERSLWDECADLCRHALTIEPFSDFLYYHLLESLLALDQKQAVVDAYEQARATFAENFGTLPAEELRALYYEAVKHINDRAVSIDDLYQDLTDDTPEGGALLCDYDFFKTICRSTVRQLSRSGITAHIALLTVSGKNAQPLPRPQHDHAMQTLEDQIQRSLRRGDIFSRSSDSQYVLLLQMSNFENSNMVCQRIIKAHRRNHPKSPAEVKHIVRTILGEL